MFLSSVFFFPNTSLQGFYSEQHASAHYNTCRSFRSLAQTVLHNRYSWTWFCHIFIIQIHIIGTPLMLCVNDDIEVTGMREGQTEPAGLTAFTVC